MSSALRTKFQRSGPFVALVLLFIVNAALNPQAFLNPQNLRNIVNQNVAQGFLALGLTWVILTGAIDLSVGSAVAFVGVVMVDAMNRWGASGPGGVLLAFAIALGGGLIVGLVNGALTAYGKVAPFVVTLVGLLAYRSAAQALANGGSPIVQNQTFSAIGSNGLTLPGQPPLVIYYSILVFAGLIVLFDFILRKTPFGRWVIAIGSNPRGAFYSGLPIARVRMACFGLAGLCIGFSAFFHAARMSGISSASDGLYWELDGIAAVVVGGTPLSGGRGSILGTLTGVLLLGMIQNILVIQNVNNYLQGIAKGLIILVAVLLQRNQHQAA